MMAEIESEENEGTRWEEKAEEEEEEEAEEEEEEEEEEEVEEVEDDEVTEVREKPKRKDSAVAPKQKQIVCNESKVLLMCDFC